MKQKRTFLIGSGLIAALFATITLFAVQSNAKAGAFDNQTNSQQNTNTKTNSKSKKKKGNSNMMMNSNSMDPNMNMNSNTAPNTNGTPQ